MRRKPTNHKRHPKVLGPYANQDKWRLVVKSGDKRKSLVFDTVQQAETARDNLLASFDDSAKLTVGDLLGQFIEHKRATWLCGSFVASCQTHGHAHFSKAR
jgi:hypothetical protein